MLRRTTKLNGMTAWLIAGSLAVVPTGCEGPGQSAANGADRAAGMGELPQGPVATAPEGERYEDHLAFLKKYTEIIEIEQGDGRIAVSPKLNGRVMTSGFAAKGPSLGWFGKEAVVAGERGITFNHFGGQDRFWLAPEGGQFGLFFDQHDPQQADYWRVPDALNFGRFDVVEKGQGEIVLARDMRLVNAAGTEILLQAERRVRPVPVTEMEEYLRTGLPRDVAYVGFVSENRIMNDGKQPLTEETGTVAIWTVGAFPANDRTVVIAPFHRRGEGERVRTTYFAKPPADRMDVDIDNGVILFRADGKFQSKFALLEDRAKEVIGSIDFENQVLTIVHFDMTPGDVKYVNALWGVPQEKPFDGEVTNVYNHGGGDSRFYEIATCSPAALLPPGGWLAHHHRTIQFHGPLETLSEISEKVLGVGLELVQDRMP